MTLDGKVRLGTGFALDLVFGVDRQPGPFIDVSKNAELIVDAGARLSPGFHAHGQIGFLQVDATDLGTYAGWRFSVDLADPSGDGLLTMSDLGGVDAQKKAVRGNPVSGRFDSLGKFESGAGAGIALHLTAGLGEDFPKIGTDLFVDWRFTGEQATGAAPDVSFKNVTLDVGGFLSKVVGPVIRQVNAVLEPVKPIIEFLTTPLPVISWITGGSSLLDLAVATGQASPTTAAFVRAVKTLPDLAERVSAIGSASLRVIDEVKFDGNQWDLRGMTSLLAPVQSDDPDQDGKPLLDEFLKEVQETPQFKVQATDLSQHPDLLQFADLGKRFKALRDMPSQDGRGLEFPLLQNPAMAFRLLLGQDIDLFHYDMPSLQLENVFGPAIFPIFPPFLTIIFSGLIGARADFDFGMTTRGFREALQTGDPTRVVNGLYLDDHVEGGRDLPEVALYGGVAVAAAAGIGFDFGFASVEIFAGVEGGVYVKVTANLNDPNPDGKVYLDEIAANFRQGVLSVLDFQGSVTAALDAFIRLRAKVAFFTITIVDVRLPIAEIELLSLDTSSDAGPPTTELGEVKNGKLTLFCGPNAFRRTGIDNSDGDETFQVVRGETDDQVVVTAFGVSRTYSGVSSIFADGGAGNDTITVDPSVPLPIELRGGAGDDRLRAGKGRAKLLGGPGNDALYGGPATDYLDGGPGDDQLFGDGGNDVLIGGNGADLLDGGQGDDDLQGGEGRDVLRGGAGSDRLYGQRDDDLLEGGTGDDTLDGGSDNDKLYGQAGNDRLVGGDGRDILDGGGGHDTLDGGFANDELFGGDGIDYLYGYSFSTGFEPRDSTNHVTTEAAYPGEEFHGGSGGDWLFGSIRSETFYGDGGNDTIQGDALVGPNYATNPRMALVGGADTIYGGPGEDRLYGGGGDDEIGGGADSDWLEGQNGVDTLYGGSGIDMLVLDTSPDYAEIGPGQYEVFRGHFGNLLKEDTPDDNATDILLIEGTDSDDVIRIGQDDVGRLLVQYNSRLLSAVWRSPDTDPNGTPLVEQFRISGLGGNDDIQFVSQAAEGLLPLDVAAGLLPLDVSDLMERSEDWVAVIDGGPGNDTLRGTSARDRIDGGAGWDTIYGMAGDDQLWGDGGPGMGDRNDKDVIYGGQGNDDLIGGQGQNVLFAWSQDPGPERDAEGNLNPSFGIWVDPTNPYILHGEYAEGRVLEDTGLNRMLGGTVSDVLYGGTGLDFLYGNDNTDGSRDVLINRHGERFPGVDSELAGDEWKQYAQSTDKVWYYSGSNLDDVITIDYVTEPGLLQGHHLITRLTNNNGNYTFDAQVRLDFGATDPDGNLIWNPNDTYYGLAVIGRVALPADGRVSSDLGDLRIGLSVDGSDSVEVIIGANDTAENKQPRDLVADLQKALVAAGLAGKVGARLADGRMSLVRLGSVPGGAASLVVTSVNRAARQVLGFSDGTDGDPAGHQAIVGFVGSHGLSSLLPGEGDFLAIIIDALEGDDHVTVGPTVIKSVWTDAGPGDDRVIYVPGKPILIDQTETSSSGRNDDLGAAFNLTPQEPLSRNTTFTGLTIDNPNDSDWYQFQLVANPEAGAFLKITSISPLDRLSVELVQLTVNERGQVQDQVLLSYVGPDAAEKIIPLAELTPETDYSLHVWTDRIPTVYEIDFNLSPAGYSEDPQKPTPIGVIAPYSSIVGPPLRAADNQYQSWFTFTLSEPGRPGDHIGLNIFETTGTATLSLMDDTGRVLEAASTSSVADPAVVNLAALPAGQYRLQVSAAGPERYELVPQVARLIDGQLVYGAESLDLVKRDRDQTVVYRGDPKVIVRKDVILGGPGNDVLQGGSGEDWIFGGPGNDVLSGGFDRLAGDLLWGGPGDDIFQVVTDRLPATKAASRRVGEGADATYIPAFSDRFDGGDGDDQVLYLGGDLDINGRVVPDHVAVRWNTLLHRYEVTSRVWDFQNQQWALEPLELPAVIVANTAGPSNGQLTQDAIFKLKVGQADPVEIKILQKVTQHNPRLEHLVEQINLALREANLRDKVVAGLRGDRITLSTVAVGPSAKLWITDVNSAASNLLGLKLTPEDKPFTGQSDLAAPQQHHGFFTVVNTEQMVIDTRAGDDEVHADPEYLIRGSEWGIDPEDRPQRATLADLVIRGGDGNDRLFGGAGNDTIEGGDGADVIVGGGGNDNIDGGPGDDWIAGGTPAVVPDRYEIPVGARGSNDSPEYATFVDMEIWPETAGYVSEIAGLSFHGGDREDWYVVRAPKAKLFFGEATTAYLAPELIEVDFQDASDQDRLDLYRVQVFAGLDSDPGPGLSVVPVEEFSGVPEYYVIRVVNLESPAALGEYTLRFHTGGTIDVAAAAADAHVNPFDRQDRPVALPLGDLNGDGYDDFVGAVYQIHDRYYPVYLARIYFGGEITSGHNPAANALTLELEAPLLPDQPDATHSEIVEGDFNGDGLQDIAIGVVSPKDAPLSVQIILGRSTFGTEPLRLSAKKDADVTVDVGVGHGLSLANAGDVDKDGREDLVMGLTPPPVTGWIQRPSAAGGNGHWYTMVTNPAGWWEAKRAAEGMGGHLVTLTSAAENQFVWETFLKGLEYPDYFAWIGLYDWGDWATVYHDGLENPEEQWRCNFKWVTGEPFIYGSPPGQFVYIGYVKNNESSLGVANYSDYYYTGRGASETSGTPYDIEVAPDRFRHHYAFVAEGESGVGVYDVSDPDNPFPKDHFDIGGTAYDLEVVYTGNWWDDSYQVFIAAGDGGLVVGDALLEDYADDFRFWDFLFWPDSYQTDGTAYDVDVVVDYTYGLPPEVEYVYVADGENGLLVVKFSARQFVGEFVGALDTNGIAYGVKVAGDYAYVADGSNGLLVIDVSKPSGPRLVGRYDTPGTAYDVEVFEHYAYLACGSSGLLVFDVSVPAAPALVGSYDTSGTARDVEIVSGWQAYLADGEGGFLVFDVSNPANPSVIWDPYPWYANAYAVAQQTLAWPDQSDWIRPDSFGVPWYPGSPWDPTTHVTRVVLYGYGIDNPFWLTWGYDLQIKYIVEVDGTPLWWNPHALLFNGSPNWEVGGRVELHRSDAAVTLGSEEFGETLMSDVQGVGDFNGDEVDDFAILEGADGSGQGKVYVYYGWDGSDPGASRLTSGTVAAQASLTITHNASLEGFELLRAQNVAPDRNTDSSSSPEEHDDFLIASDSGTYLVLGHNYDPKTIVTLDESSVVLLDSSGDGQFGAVRPMGDVDGDGYGDLGMVFLEKTSDLNNLDAVLQHAVGWIVLGGAGLFSEDSTGRFFTPDLIVEPQHALYAEPSELYPPVQLFSFGSVGDINGDGLGDFANVDSFGGNQIHLFLGRPLTPLEIQPPSVAAKPPSYYQVDLAFPLPAGAVTRDQVIDLTAESAGAYSIAKAFALKGTAQKEQIASSISLGDINGDGFGDFLFTGPSRGYIVLGPIQVAGTVDIATQASVIVDLAKLGRPAQRVRDIDGDGRSDLVFLSKPEKSDTVTMYVVLGKSYLPSELSTNNVDRTIQIADPAYASEDVSQFSVQALYWNQDELAPDAYADLLVMSPQQGYIFSGQVIRNAEGLLLPKHALAQIIISTPTLNVAWTKLVAQAVGDTDGDGLEDIALGEVSIEYVPGLYADMYKHSANVRLLYGQTGETFRAISADTLPAITVAARYRYFYESSWWADTRIAIFELGELDRDGYDDFATVVRSTNADVDDRIDIFRGVPERLNGDTESWYRFSTIHRVGGTLGVTVSLTPAAGDFDGDGDADLAILESTRLVGGGAATDGKVHLFWDAGALDRDVALSDAGLLITSQPDVGIITAMCVNPSAELNGDRADDLLFGAPKADDPTGSGYADVGKVFIVYGRQRAVLDRGEGEPVVLLSNRSVSGSGEYLVADGSGHPVRFENAGPEDTR